MIPVTCPGWRARSAPRAPRASRWCTWSSVSGPVTPRSALGTGPSRRSRPSWWRVRGGQPGRRDPPRRRAPAGGSGGDQTQGVRVHRQRSRRPAARPGRAPRPGAAGGARRPLPLDRPTSTGGSPITGYQVMILRMSSSLPNATVLSSTTSAVLGASVRQLSVTLANGNYRFQVVAINAIGTSQPLGAIGQRRPPLNPA